MRRRLRTRRRETRSIQWTAQYAIKKKKWNDNILRQQGVGPRAGGQGYVGGGYPAS
ncbi:unnamed protein product, partial [Ascophyllum nodosum]